MSTEISHGLKGQYCLNGFHIALSADEFEAYVIKEDSDDHVTNLRKSHSSEWSFLRRPPEILALPTVASPKQIFPDRRTLAAKGHDGLSLLKSRFNEVLPEIVKSYEPHQLRPFKFLAQKNELVEAAVSRWQSVPEILECFQIRPVFGLEARILERTPDDLEMVLVLGVSMNWRISCPLEDLLEAGIDLGGCYAIRRLEETGKRRSLGRIGKIEGGIVHLDESWDGEITVPVADARLEGSKASFKRCLLHILGQRDYTELSETADDLQSEFTTGPAIVEVLKKMGKMLGDQPEYELTPGIKASIATGVRLKNKDNYKTVIELPPVQHCFDAGKTQRHEYPWEGLKVFGPFDRESFEHRSPQVLVVAPDHVRIKAEQMIGSLAKGIPGSPYNLGFDRLFHLHNPHFEFCDVTGIADDATAYLAYRKAVEGGLKKSTNYNAAIVILHDRYINLPDRINPYISAKSLLMTSGIPVQEMRVSTASKGEKSLAYILKSVAVALYAKMGGVPWTVAHQLPYNEELVIGIGMAELSGSRTEQRQRHVGITTVFQGDGNYLLSNVSKECKYEDYPEALKASTIEILSTIRKRNGWEPGQRIRLVFHTSKPLKNVELDSLLQECIKEAAPEQSVEFACLVVKQDHPFRILDFNQAGEDVNQRNGPIHKKAVYVPARGVVMQLGAATRLLCTNGPKQIKRPETPLPRPLLIHLQDRSTCRDLSSLTEQILKFTSLAWRSTLPSERPVTIYYSELIAGLIARLRADDNWSPALLNTKLRASKWFL